MKILRKLQNDRLSGSAEGMFVNNSENLQFSQRFQGIQDISESRYSSSGFLVSKQVLVTV